MVPETASARKRCHGIAAMPASRHTGLLGATNTATSRTLRVAPPCDSNWANTGSIPGNTCRAQLSALPRYRNPSM